MQIVVEASSLNQMVSRARSRPRGGEAAASRSAWPAGLDPTEVRLLAPRGGRGTLAFSVHPSDAERRSSKARRPHAPTLAFSVHPSDAERQSSRARRPHAPSLAFWYRGVGPREPALT